MAIDKIVIKGAKVHNLKNIDVEIPRYKFVVITGLSGSGKSSLAFDTIYAEGQRRYVESLSAYARQFLGQMDKPDVEYIEGLSPAISIDQKTTNRNPRSTVGTVTEIYDYLRLLYARIGIPHCPKCGKEISMQTVDQMVDRIMKLNEGTRIQVLSPIIRGRKGEYQKLMEDIKKSGYVRVRIDGIMYDLSEEIKLEKNKKHTIEVVIDRIIIKPHIESRLTDSIESALKLSDGVVTIDVIDGEGFTMSEKYSCPDCNIGIEELSPRMFSFNSPYGACPTCAGLGEFMRVDPDLLLPDRSKSLKDGAFSGFIVSQESYTYQNILNLVESFGYTENTPLEEYSDDLINILLYGKDKNGKRHGFEGIVNNLERRYNSTNSSFMREEIEKYMRPIVCPDCHGARLKPEVLAVTVGGMPINKITDLSVTELLRFMDELKLTEREEFIAHQIIKEIKARLNFLKDVGLDYLTLSRNAGTLSGGESQRIRLASQIGSGLVGVTYILDEPSIGLHQRDNERLLNSLKKLKDQGNTLIVVEHDEDTMFAADYIVDVGPGPGEHGGKIVAAGTVEDIMACEESLTGQYLSGKKKIDVPKTRRKPNGHYLTVRGASENNLKNIDVTFPLGILICITGVSGSGKSTLINEILYKALAQKLYKAKDLPGKYSSIEGIEFIDKVINIDQSPIGRTPRSNPATYTGVFDPIRELFSNTPDAKMRGYKPGRFSFNVKGGRCEACSGDGIIKIEMNFLPDVYVPCEVCKGNRYNRETLEIKYKGKNISDVLNMTVEEALDFFKNIPRIKSKLETLNDVGLGYIKLGQPSTQLSGGEAQRVKLATELSRRSTGKTVYILDEPTTGLHFADVDRLLDVLNRLVDGGNTVIVIEHNLDVIKSADYIIDMGPEGGDRGGRIVATGTPEEVAENNFSYTGQFLKKILARQ
ncbi:excinuclease ABC, A subunit [Thermoanaerobacterium thermosaccharolyticum DSM 571]|uniref:UvrABC system protein A n=1 Tax=Thermoanaerobacterium thermosaccharolyticum (strain ATCC 7956 / DSM 571 / NCIMB 9385 / NCA 3814 / NCTC 13789 / WDCM 00135 / 2032) TaxID=580327 RepID=D9TT46_THETC|nr:excinuclease ABC subunit UvrA [Thermoanaerobacterium thermosaccharolyticum]ADL68188.1 excinuclease ABC, A subunit [Thermoanaerobacterium thermosaccharolyticum DSM 571]